MLDILTSSLTQLHKHIQNRTVSVSEICQVFLDRIAEVDERVRAFVNIDSDAVLKRAMEIDLKLQKKDFQVDRFTGIPIALKDVIVTLGQTTTCGSKMLEGYIPPYDATVVERLKAKGAIVLGKTNCDEFAMGSSTENSAFFVTRNPWDLERVPGGSSGGSAACVAAFEAPVALGTDTGGSIRQPAAFCGIVGLKPTYGRVSRYGLVAFASSLDQIGPLTRSVEDAASTLSLLAGPDPRDSTCLELDSIDFAANLNGDISDLRIGVARDWIDSVRDPDTRKALEKAIRILEGSGLTVEDVAFPNQGLSIATYYLVATAEASANLARYDGVRFGYRSTPTTDLESMYRKTRSEGFGPEVKRRIMLGTFALSSGYYDAYYKQASKVRRLIREDFLAAFKQVDIILGPVTPTPAFKVGEKTDDPLEMYLSDVFTVSANLAGLPGLSLPTAFTERGLPVGLQLLASHFEEEKLLRAAHFLESELAVEKPSLPIG